MNKVHRCDPPAVRVKWEERRTTRGIAVRHIPDIRQTPSQKSTPQSGSQRPERESDAVDEYSLIPPLDISHSNNKSPNDYIREWLPYRAAYLDVLISREARSGTKCRDCNSEAIWRCETCFHRPAMCLACCRRRHLDLPFHRVLCWTGTHFSSSWLSRVGIEIYLGHVGHKCPTETTYTDGVELEDDSWSDIDEEEAADSFLDKPTLHAADDFPRILTNEYKNVVTVVDTSGIHQLNVIPCSCEHADPEHIQYLKHGLFPASFKRIRTVFTFQVLNDFRLDNLVSKTTAYQYYNKLRRVTCPAFPHRAPNRYRELMRVSRLWRDLKRRKWHGFGHEAGEPQQGELAVFCAACPQPGLNLADNWKADEDKTVYTRSLVLDGNFTAAHLKQKHPEDDVWLNTGAGFMTQPELYKEHLKIAEDTRQKSNCRNFRAQLDQNLTHHGCDSTGIGAVACARHGCFAPSSVVDFQKGERRRMDRQMNMDYALCQAISNSNMKGIPRLIMLYDIACQHSKYLKSRIAASPFLSIDPSLQLVPGIGLFHVHEHVKECFVRYAPTFIAGAGQVDGEILETLWACLNRASPCTRTATLAHRAELLDDHMGDSNWKKMLGIVASVVKKYKAAIVNSDESRQYFFDLSAAADKTDVESWELMATQADVQRENNIEVMNIYEAAIPQLPSRAEIELQMIQTDQTAPLSSAAAWLVSGMKLEEKQINLRSHIRRISGLLSAEQQLEIARKRERLRTQINNFNSKFCNYVDFDQADLELGDTPSISDEEWEEEANPFRTSPSTTLTPAEKLPLHLPSRHGRDKCMFLGIARLVEKELELRRGQANDCLALIRQKIGEKSFLFRQHLRKAEGKKGKTRAWDSIHSVDHSLQLHRIVYTSCRRAIASLADTRSQLLEIYQPILKEHLKASVIVVDTNAPNQRNVQLPWFWTMKSGNEVEGLILKEFYRVHWLRARAKHLRWQEELHITQKEMEWTARFFLNQAQRWRDRYDAAASRNSDGHAAYAARQVEMWEGFVMQANDDYIRNNPSYIPVVTL